MKKLKGREKARAIASKWPMWKPGLVVHHIDGNIENNDPLNLMILTYSAHKRIHNSHIPPKPRKPKGPCFKFAISQDDYEVLKKLALKDRDNVSGYVRRLIGREIDKIKNGKEGVR